MISLNKEPKSKKGWKQFSASSSKPMLIVAGKRYEKVKGEWKEIR